VSARRLRAIDVCCGAGGWGVAARGLPIDIEVAYDREQDCLDTYAYNFPATKTVKADVAELDWSKLTGIDVVLGGIPCETVTPCRKNRKNPVGDRELSEWHKLIDSILAGIEVARPRYWCFENVIQMRLHLPPLVPQWYVNASEFSGQSRKRMWIGNFPTPCHGSDRSVLADYLRKGPYVMTARVKSDVTFTAPSTRMKFEKSGGRWIDPRRKCPTIVKCSKRWGDWCIQLGDGRHRVLQFTEAAALHGFPDDYVFISSQDRAWKMVGQAIPIPVGAAILRSICADFGVTVESDSVAAQLGDETLSLATHH
jgi:site-specific DNA-cytosine methylase